MKRLPLYLQQMVLVCLVVGLAACVPQNPPVKPAEDSPLQQAISVREQLITSKNALVAAYDTELARRKTDPKGMPYISEASYNVVWKVADDAMKIADKAVALAHSSDSVASDGITVPVLLEKVKAETAKVDEGTATINKAAGK